jgi:DNA repair protein RadD
MILRPRQQVLVDRARKALQEHGNTLAVAPTGAGKTVMLSAIAGSVLNACTNGRAVVLQHRDELVAQNRKTFHALHGINKWRTGVIDARDKDFGRDVAFAMVQTLSGDKNLEAMRPVDLLVVDEAHHAVANSYQKIIDRAKDLNPVTKILGVTATPNRGDKKALREIFDNVSDQISLGELIAAGHLVKPRTFVIDLGVTDELRQVRKSLSDFDMSEVEKIMDKDVLNEKVVEEWRRVAGDRRTVVFCSTVAHALHVRDVFIQAGVAAVAVTGDMPQGQRESFLQDFDTGKIQVIVNVAVLTEGWDCPPTGCVILLRPSSYKSTMIQMVGRGLRTIDPEKYPGIVKTDCIVMDFGTSTLTHGSLEQDVNLDGAPKGESPKKTCPECEAEVPMFASECSICGHVFVVEDPALPSGPSVRDTLTEFGMTEIDLFEASPFKWEDLWNDGSMLVASAFDAWAMCVFYAGTWHAIGGATGQGIRHLAAGEQLVSLAMADDFMRDAGDTESAAKSRRWLHLSATDKQLQHLGLSGPAAVGITRYKAACLLTFKFNERGIKSRLQGIGKIAA